ncbi:MAG TPA: LacI family DNA-binding transcriptional regulator [Gaiellaceae bacterium]|jgi:LacI family transcriptional regulator|nr:LacI family DNA-binding transcriptional regulator [Gaiellaceae bacterium]
MSELAPGPPETTRHRVTIREIAELAGVSIATVSRVLNERDDVSDETRELVRRIVREHGYRANRSARSLSRGHTGLVGVLVPLVHPAYFSAILSGAAEALYEQDMRLVLSPTLHEHDREVSLVDRLAHGLTDGALLVLPEESSEELQRLLDEGYRFVVVDPLEPLPERVPSVSAAHASGADQAMRHLLDLGHRRIAAITGPKGWVATDDRLRGFHAALAAAGIMPDPKLEVAADFEIGGGERAAHALLDLAEPPTAIFAFNDNMAVGAIQAARARGVRVPEQLSVVGFDDTEQATIVTPTLTTVRQPLAEMGRMAVSLLVRLLERQRFETLHVELATRLVVRESTAPPAA